MDLNSVQLTSQLLSELYPNVLVEINTTPMPESSGIKYVGKNLRKILVVTASEDAGVIKEKELTFLKNILLACKLTTDDVAVVNWQNTIKNYQELVKYFESKTVLLFNVDPLTFGLPINFPLFQIQQFSKCTYLFAPELRLLQENIALKRQLWAALKKIFPV
ncbi:MAG: hypothetical protein ICV66_00275 [Chitinophagaceae bacterium]|nr:hypothetical protein [Chitinophagaceae bacterium]